MTVQSLLTDDQMRQFLSEGYLILKADFPQSFHEQLFEKLNEVYEKEGNPGNNLLPRIPELQDVFDHPVVAGALTSVLGENYMMHPHRHGHFNKSSKPGGWHKDSYWGYGKIRNHRPWWAMIFYYPQDVTLDMGPTALMPGTFAHEQRNFENDENAHQVKSLGTAGTFVLIHYDIWHRATANISGKDRYMLKFEFIRTERPERPTWDNQMAEWTTPAHFTQPVHAHEVMWRDAWNWLRGAEGAPAAAVGSSLNTSALLAQLQSEDKAARVEAANAMGLASSNDQEVVQALKAALTDPFEPVALNAAYGLSTQGEEGREALLGSLDRADNGVSRLAAHALPAAGAAAVEGLREKLDSDDAELVARAAFALGEIGPAAEDALAALVRLMQHPNERVRREVTEALGMIGSRDPSVVEALERGLVDEDVQVRFTCGLSLARLGPAADAAVPGLQRALSDENRYVRANAAEALYYIGSKSATDVLLRFLRVARWCPTTTPENTFYP